MKIAFILAYKNLMGAGLRTWLNVIILALVFIMIIFFNGLMDGWNLQAKTDTIDWEYGFGQYHHNDYDPYDMFTIEDAHGTIPQNLDITPILLHQASIYPDNRMVPTIIKGINANQTILELPTPLLKSENDEVTILVGKRMAESNHLKTGDNLLLRWRDINGTFDAMKVKVVGVFDSNVPSVDQGTVWMDLATLEKITGFKNQATMLIVNNKEATHQKIKGWNFKSNEELLKNLTNLINSKKIGSAIMYLILLFIGLLAIFDTQVLSIFRRQKEIGSYVALGMTRNQVLKIFTFEGTMYSIMGCVLGGIIGTPLFIYLSKVGIKMSAAQQDMGIAISESIHPHFGIKLIITTILILIISATFVSFLPARKISKMNVVDAIKGKIQ